MPSWSAVTAATSSVPKTVRLMARHGQLHRWWGQVEGGGAAAVSSSAIRAVSCSSTGCQPVSWAWASLESPPPRPRHRDRLP
jgi:hypothetical protein